MTDKEIEDLINRLEVAIDYDYSQKEINNLILNLFKALYLRDIERHGSKPFSISDLVRIGMGINLVD